MEKEKYSFIIPAYNSEKIIEKCLDNIIEDIKQASLSEQTEIIIIENGSKDKTTKVVESYIKKRKKYNIILLHSEKGVSKARNEGIKNAKGQFLIFVDSDDKWLNGSLSELEKDINKSNADLYAYSFIKGTDSQSDIECIKNIHDAENINTYSKVNMISWFLSKPTYRMQVWGKVFKREIINKEKIMYNETLRYSEDSEFLIRYLLACETVEISSHPIYKYVISPSSVMHTADDTRINGYISSMEVSEKYLKNTSQEIRNAFSKYVISHLNIILVHDIFEAKNKLFKNKIFKTRYKKMKELFSKKIFKNNLDNLKTLDCIDKTLLPEFFYKLHLPILTAILCYLKSYLNLKHENK